MNLKFCLNKSDWLTKILTNSKIAIEEEILGASQNLFSRAFDRVDYFIDFTGESQWVGFGLFVFIMFYTN